MKHFLKEILVIKEVSCNALDQEPFNSHLITNIELPTALHL